MLYPLWIRKKLSKYTHIEYTLSPWLSRENVRKTYFARCMPTGYRKSHFPMIKWKIIIYKLSLGCKKHPRFLNFYLQNDRFRYRPCSRGAHKWRFVFLGKRGKSRTSSARINRSLKSPPESKRLTAKVQSNPHRAKHYRYYLHKSVFWDSFGGIRLTYFLWTDILSAQSPNEKVTQHSQFTKKCSRDIIQLFLYHTKNN